MNEQKPLTLETELTIKEAADLTKRSVQSFYSEKRRQDFGYDKRSGGKWRIPVSLLVKHGLLTSDDFQPTKQPVRSVPKAEELIDRSEIERLEMLVSELEKQRDTLEMLVHSQRRQIEMLEERLGLDEKSQ